MIEDKKLDRIMEYAERATIKQWQASYFVDGPHLRSWSPAQRNIARRMEAKTIRLPGVVGSPSCNPAFTIEGPSASPENVTFIGSCDPETIIEMILEIKEHRRISTANEAWTAYSDMNHRNALRNHKI